MHGINFVLAVHGAARSCTVGKPQQWQLLVAQEGKTPDGWAPCNPSRASRMHLTWQVTPDRLWHLKVDEVLSNPVAGLLIEYCCASCRKELLEDCLQ